VSRLLTSLHPSMTDHIAANKRRAQLLVAGFVAPIVVLGVLVGLLAGNLLIGALVGVGVSALSAGTLYRQADAIALRVSRAVPADPEQHQRLHNLVDGLCVANGLPKPRVFVVADPAPNAFVVGLRPRNASLAVTTGLLDTMNRVELEGVVAYQLASVRSYDTLVATLAPVMLAPLALAGDLLTRLRWWNGGRSAREGDRPERSNPVASLGLVLLALGSYSAAWLRAVVGSERVVLADLAACQMTRYPPGLLSALEKMRADSTVSHSATSATAHLWMAQPLSGTAGDGPLAWAHRRFDAHPPLDDRIAVLREL